MACESQFFEACEVLQSVGISGTRAEWDCRTALTAWHMFTCLHVFTLNVGALEHWLTSAGLLQLHSEGPALWFLTLPQLLRKFLPRLQHPEVFSHIFATKSHSGEKGTESQALLTWSFIAEHGRPGSPIPNLNLPVGQGRMGWKANRNLSNTAEMCVGSNLCKDAG